MAGGIACKVVCMDAHHEVERQGCRINRTRPEREAQDTPQGCGTAAVSFWLLYSLSKQRKSHSPRAKPFKELKRIDCHRLRLRKDVGLGRLPQASPSQRRGLGEIATSYAFAKTWAWGGYYRLRLGNESLELLKRVPYAGEQVLHIT